MEQNDLPTQFRIYMVKNGYQSQADFAQAFGVARSTVTKWLKGENKIPPDQLMRLGQFFKFTSEEWISFCGAAGYIFLPAAIGQQVLKNNEVAITMIQQLNEWKIVHSTVQKFLFSIKAPLAGLEQFRRNQTDDLARDVETVWFKQCEGKAREIRNCFSNFSSISHPDIVKLHGALQGERYVVKYIYALKVQDFESLQNLDVSFGDLLGLLEDLLTAADNEIKEIAQKLLLQI